MPLTFFRPADLARSQTRQVLADMLPQAGLQGDYGYMHGLEVGDETVLDGGSSSLTLNKTLV